MGRGGEELVETARGGGVDRDPARCWPSKPANWPLPPFPNCLACRYCLGSDGQTRVRLRGRAGIFIAKKSLDSSLFPPHCPLERRISMPRCQGTCPLFLEGLWLGGGCPGCPHAHTPPTITGLPKTTLDLYQEGDG